MRKKLVANSLINLVGQIIPVFVGIFAIRVIVHGLGIEEFGLLTLLWAALGYFAFLDLGLGRAIIKFVAEGFEKGEREKNAGYFWYSIFVMTAFSVTGTLLLYIFAPQVVELLAEIPQNLNQTALGSFRIMGLMIPLVIWTSALRGVLEADSRFFLANILTAINGICNYLVPAIVITLGGHLYVVMMTLLAVRVVILLIHCLIIFGNYPEFRRFNKLSKLEVKKVLSFGGWATVSNIISPMMMYFDRFVLSSMLPVGMIAYYTTPYEMVSRLMIIPAAIARTLFPELSKVSKGGDSIEELFAQSLKYVLSFMFFISASLILFAQFGLKIWLGDDFSHNSYLILQVFALGLFFNSLGNIPYTYVHSMGRPDSTAKMHLVELPIYLVLLFSMVKNFGILGAAWAWLIRAALDFFILTYLTIRVDSLFTRFWKYFYKRISFLVVVLVALMSLKVDGLYYYVYGSGIIAVTLVAIWFLILDQRDRDFVIRRLPRWN